MYGTRAASQVWQDVVRENMVALGFEMNPIFPCVYSHREKDMTIVTHVDDFLCSGRKSDLIWFRKMLTIQFELKSDILGHGAGEVAEFSFLGRTIRTTVNGLDMEGDPKHAKILLEEWDMENSRSVTSPGAESEKANVVEKQDEEELIQGLESTIYRRAAARLNYMSADRADLSYAAKECSRGMANPTRGDVVRLKRVLRYLKGASRVVNLFVWQSPQSQLVTYSDSEWAGCAKTRKSTTGGVIMLGSHMLAHWSSTQSTIALSSAEAELNALVKAVSETMGILKYAEGDGEKGFKARILTDSSAAKGIVHRVGCGKVKHLEARQLWVQDAVRRRSLKLRK